MSTPFFRVAALSALALAASFSTAQAASLPANGDWAEFAVELGQSGNLEWLDPVQYSQISFNFVIADGYVGTLSVVDKGVAGDRFAVYDNNTLVGMTSQVANGSFSDDIVTDAQAAFDNSKYSRGVFTLTAGSHSITGLLTQSFIDPDTGALNATIGGLKLEVSPVPEPATLATLLAGLSLLTVALRRRNNGQK